MLDKTIDNFKSLSRGRPSFIQGEPIQPMENRLNVILSPNLLHKFLCVPLSQVLYQNNINSLNRPCLTCLVARARVERSSTIIFTRICVKAGVGGILV